MQKENHYNLDKSKIGGEERKKIFVNNKSRLKFSNKIDTSSVANESVNNENINDLNWDEDLTVK